MIRNITPLPHLPMVELDLLDLLRLRDLENLMTAYPRLPLQFSRIRLNFKGAHTELQPFEEVLMKLGDMNPQFLHLMCQALNKPTHPKFEETKEESKLDAISRPEDKIDSFHFIGRPSLDHFPMKPFPSSVKQLTLSEFPLDYLWRYIETSHSLQRVNILEPRIFVKENRSSYYSFFN